MKHLNKVKLLVALVLVAFCGMTLATELVVVIKNITQESGTINIALYDGEKSFKDHVILEGTRVDAKTPSVTIRFELDEGEYAIRVYHDVDSNGEMNFNRLRMPSEPYAFSNNVKPRFGPPGWKKTKFSVGKEKVTQELTLLGS